MMDIETFEALLGDEGQEILAKLASSDLNEENTLKYLTELRKFHPRELAEATVETALLRKRAASKFSRAGSMYFTREALEQSSGEVISCYRSERFVPYSYTADMACGIGGDAIPLARHCRVLAVDKDPLRLAMLRKNAEVYGVSDRIETMQADIIEVEVPEVDAVFFDPARRVEGRRAPSVSDYSPPLSIVEKWLPKVPAVGVKISPAVKYSEITWDCEIEMISVSGELKEAVLWFGEFKTAERRATLLPSKNTLTSTESPISIPVQPPKAYLYEPDPAVIRAQLVEELADEMGAVKIDYDIAYLTSDERTATPFARRYAVLEVMPFGVKKLNERLRALDVGRVIIKKRGSPLEPQELQKKLKLTGSCEIVVVLTHINGKPGIILCSEDNK